MSNTKAMKAHFKNFTLFVNAKHVVGELGSKKIHSYSINSVSVKNNADGVISNLKSKLTEKQIGKLLTSADYPIRKNGVVNSFGKAMRQAIKSVFGMNTTRDAYSQNGTDLKEKDSAYAFIDTTGGIVKIWIIDVDYSNQYARCFIDRITGTVTCIVCKENDDSKSTCDIYQELICDNNGREGRANPFAKGKNMTHHLEHMNKIETRGRKARKVESVITVNSTLEENNAATVEIKEKYNEVADIVNVQQDELAALKAEIAQLKAAMNPTQELIKAMQPRTESIFARPVATAKQEAMLDLDAIKAVPFTFESELERL
ncbi:hypothetical protein [Aeromonas piscicola]|uniref:hypothetical protein n=1 Tax=Aeromonas piscicola TaxID=600645 RepID=UPI0021F8318A|nr:hypothetical protein [Aeromonas piscicola]MCW0507029.1 hypothetical protein [Aeromonas piscicola]